MPIRDSNTSTLYGKGVFTTLAIHAGRPFLWEKHWRRIVANAEVVGVDLSEHEEAATLDSLLQEISACGILNGRARITFSDQSPSSIWSSAGEKKTSLSIIVAERRPVAAKFKLTISPHRINTTSPLVGIKSCNYLDHLLAYEEAAKRGFHEAIRLNERGEIAAACMANVFWETDGKLFTPSLSTGCLPGTTREFILENTECEEVEAGIEGLREADRIFLTSAGIGIVTVAHCDERRLDISEHRLTSIFPGLN